MEENDLRFLNMEKEKKEKENKMYRWLFFWTILMIVLVGVRVCTRQNRQELRRMDARHAELHRVVWEEIRAVWSAESPDTSIEQLKVFARDDRAAVRASVARNPNTPVKILEELAKDRERFVLISVAGNPNTPVETLRALAEKGNAEIQMAINSNPNAPAELRSIVQ